MTNVGQPERQTQNRVLTLFRDELGYRYIGDWTDRLHNSNIDERLLTDWLTKNGHTPEQISRAIYLLKIEADNPNRGLTVLDQGEVLAIRFGPVPLFHRSIQ